MKHQECLHVPHLVCVTVVLHFAEPHLDLLLTSKENREPPKFLCFLILSFNILEEGFVCI